MLFRKPGAYINVNIYHILSTHIYIYIEVQEIHYNYSKELSYTNAVLIFKSAYTARIRVCTRPLCLGGIHILFA